MQNDYRAPDHKPTLMDRAREWVRNNVPVHSQAEMDMLLTMNSDLMLRLLSKCIDFDALLKEHMKLQFEVAKQMPQVPWVARSDVRMDIADLSRTYTIEWRIDPMRQRLAVSDREHLRRRIEVPEIGHAMRRYFDEVTAPSLFNAAMSNLHSQLARAA